MGEPEQPGDGDEHGHGEAHLPDHGEEGAGRGGRGLREVRNRGQDDGILQAAAGHGLPGQLHDGQPGGDHPGAITSDAKIQATLRKKLKGRYEKDKALLEKVAGLPEQEASDWAFLAAEVINWEWLAQVLEAAGWEGTTQEAIDIIRAAVIVEEGMKVGVEADKPEV